MKKRYHCLLIAAPLLLLTACKKFIDIPPPVTEAETAVIFENDQAAIAATVGLYAQMMQTSLSVSNGGGTIYPALSADELYNTAASTDYDVFRNNNITTNATGLTRLWQVSYRSIYHANVVMEALDRSATVTDSLKEQLKGEMLLTRAFHYFTLVNLFGDVPLVTSKSFETNQSLPREASSKVYDQIVTDLIAAKSKLKEAYPVAGRYRPNKHAAGALLARVYLYLKQWPLAEQEATAIISSPLYSLPANLGNVFLTGSSEAIWQLSPVSTTIHTAEGNLFNPASVTTKPTFAATTQLLADLDPADQRKTNWLKAVTVSGQTYNYPYKYKVRTGAAPYTEMYMVFRLAELYLVRAEARAQQDNIALAIADINVTRQRAGLPALPTINTQANTLLAVEKERRTELMFEWGHRWFDLKRTNRAMDILPLAKGASFTANDLLYPLPQYEIDTNPFLIQNPGY